MVALGRSAVRIGTFTAAGPPSADLGPNGRIQVVARAADGIIHHTGETDTFSGVWGDWARTQPADDSFRAATDPTAFEYLLPDRPTWAFVVRDHTEAVRVYTPVSTASRTDGRSSVRFTPTTLRAASE
ncbi:hypothetical protein GCM10009780_10150 [Actinomadura alba]